MRFVLMVTGPAYGTQQASSAYQFTKALLVAGHKIINIFFYQDGVHNANLFTLPATDEIDLVRSWQNIHDQYDIPLHVCIAAALRRGITNTTEMLSTRVVIANLQDGFLLSGLGVLAEAILTCDRLIQF